ncbi:hypothetical protein EBZ37_03770 [bacterium]|nr:hypothetical protein [bacterium]
MSPTTQNNKVLVGFTGGIRSSVTAMLLKTQGADLFGVFLDYEGTPWDTNCSRESRKLAVEQAAALEIPLVTVPVASLFEALVADSYLHDVLNRKVPQTCLSCHRRILFPVLSKIAEERGISTIATGHRAALNQGQLERTSAPDDQSAWLAFLPRELLRQITLPLGALSTMQVRKLAHEITPDWPKEAINETRSACMLSQEQWMLWASSRVPTGSQVPGPMTHRDSISLAEHRGILQYPLGSPILLEERGSLMVWDYEPSSHCLKLEDRAQTGQTEIQIEGLNWIDPAPQEGTPSVEVEVRSAGMFSDPASVSSGLLFFHLENEARLFLRKPMTALVRGTPLIFSSDTRILGAGWVT